MVKQMYVLTLLYMCRHTSSETVPDGEANVVRRGIHFSSYHYMFGSYYYMCVVGEVYQMVKQTHKFDELHTCPHTSTCVSSYYNMSGIILLCGGAPDPGGEADTISTRYSTSMSSLPPVSQLLSSSAPAQCERLPSLL
jgi:hypothetical protein